MADADRYEQVLGPLRIGLRRDLHFSRQAVGERVLYVAHDPITFQNHSFGPTDYRILTALSPRRSFRATFEALVGSGELREADRARFYEFLLQLHALNLLHLPLANPATLWERHTGKRRARRFQWMRALLYHRMPLWDPDRWLERALPYVRWLFTRPGVALWLTLIAVSVWACLGRFGELFAQSAGLIALSNLPILLIALVGLKAVHELGHALMCKSYGGEVPEIGIAWILGIPCAYVDASASWKFTSPGQRVAVAMAGMYVESFAAASAAIVWASTAPGFVHDVAWNVMLLAGAVTLLFNLNPLMRFDGYYALTDVLAMPNLAERAQRHVKNLLKRALLGLQPPPLDLGSVARRVFHAGYGVAAVAYKILLAFSIYALVLARWPGGGVVLAVLFGWLLLAQPFLRMLRWLLHDQETALVRMRARGVAVGAGAAAFVLYAFVPISWSVVVPGLLEPAERITLRAPADAFVAQHVAATGSELGSGDVVLQLHNEELALAVAQAEQHAAALVQQGTQAQVLDPARARVLQQAAQVAHARARQLRAELDALCVRAAAAAQVATELPPPGTFVARGRELGELHRGMQVRVVLTSEQYARSGLRTGTAAEVRWSVEPSIACWGLVREILPVATRDELPVALTVLGGGEIYGTAHGDRLQADQPYVQVLVDVDGLPFGATAGLSARLRFAAETETLGSWVQRRLLSFWHGWRMS